MPRKWCECFAETIASIAVWRDPSVPFLKPTGMERPEAISRCVWLSVVRAPIAAQLTRSAMYCGTMGSRNSVAAGIPISFTARSRRRAIRRPVSTSYVPSRQGSLIRPFHPIVVRGFSKYTRITRKNWSATSGASRASRRAYSMAAFGSWMEHGPTTTSRRGSSRRRIRCTVSRPRTTVDAAVSRCGSASFSSRGESKGRMVTTRRSLVRCMTTASYANRRRGWNPNSRAHLRRRAPSGGGCAGDQRLRSQGGGAGTLPARNPRPVTSIPSVRRRSRRPRPSQGTAVRVPARRRSPPSPAAWASGGRC